MGGISEMFEDGGLKTKQRLAEVALEDGQVRRVGKRATDTSTNGSDRHGVNMSYPRIIK
jgi:hypothetical protein